MLDIRPVIVPATNGAEIQWAGSDFHTGVRIVEVAPGDSRIPAGAPAGWWVQVVREGKGDHLMVDLMASRFGMAPVYWTDGTVVAHLGDDSRNQIIAVTIPGVEGWEEADSVAAALVALAFWFCS